MPERGARLLLRAPREPVALPAAMPARRLLLLLLGLLLTLEPACCQEGKCRQLPDIPGKLRQGEGRKVRRALGRWELLGGVALGKRDNCEKAS